MKVDAPASASAAGTGAASRSRVSDRFQDCSREKKMTYLARSVGFIMGCVISIGAATAADAPQRAFEPVQRDVFVAPGALSNAWGDFDDDGDLDLVVSFKHGELRLYRNDGHAFSNVGTEYGLPVSGDEIRGVSWGDYDSDGDLDFIAGSSVSPVPGRSYVYRNDGDKFVEVANEIGLAIPGRSARQSNWVDFDNDGDLDLYAAHRAGRNGLYRNNGGVFTPLGRESGALDVRRTVGACWFDFDRDGDLDVFLANQAGDSDALLRNSGGLFADVAPALGMDQTLRLQSEGGVGCAIGDYDNDGDFDLYVAAYGPNLLYRNNGVGGFAEVGEVMGVAGPEKAVAASWGDFDNDGDLDLAVTGYEGPMGQRKTVVRLYRNDGERFVNILPNGDLLQTGDHGVEWVDFDNDGDLDLSFTNDNDDDGGGHYLFRNELSTEARERSLSVLALDAEGRFTKAGAEVRLFNASGDIVASRLVSTGGGYDAQSAGPLHFGLKDASRIIVEVTFLTSEGRKSRRLDGVDPADWAGKAIRILQDE